VCSNILFVISLKDVSCDKVFESCYFYNATSVAICQGQNFPAKFVIHVNSPTWGSPNAQQQLEKAVKNVLTLADSKHFRTLAVPSISSGK